MIQATTTSEAAPASAVLLYAIGGLARVDGGVLSAAEEGRAVLRSVAASFDAYLSQTPERHARTV